MTVDGQTKLFKKAIVVFYSRSGNTQFVAEDLASRLHADLVPLRDKKSRKGLWGYFWGGFDALMQNKTKLEDYNIELNNYDLIFIGCPNWAANIPPAMRTFLSQKYWANRRVVLFCTQESMGAEQVFNNLRRLVKEADVINEKYFNKVNINKDSVREQIKSWLTSLDLGL